MGLGHLRSLSFACVESGHLVGAGAAGRGAVKPAPFHGG